MSQNEMILNHLEKFGSITQAEAIECYGIYRLASRISDLKKMGHSFDREMVEGKNRFGETVRFAKYKKSAAG